MNFNTLHGLQLRDLFLRQIKLLCSSVYPTTDKGYANFVIKTIDKMSFDVDPVKSISNRIRKLSGTGGNLFSRFRV